MKTDTDRFKQLQSLCEKKYPLIYRYCFKMLRNAEDTKDLCQEIFIKISKIFEHKDPTMINDVYLFKVVNSVYIDHIRKVKKHNVVSDDVELNNLSSVFHDPEEKERILMLNHAIDKLPIRKKMMIHLYKDGFSHEDISQILKMNPNSVGKTLSRIICKLGKELSRGG